MSYQVGHSTVLIRTAVGAAFARFAISLLDASDEADASGLCAVTSGRRINRSANEGSPSAPPDEYEVVEALVPAPHDLLSVY